MGLIGQTWKHCKVWRLLVLIDQNKHTHLNFSVCKQQTQQLINHTVACVHYTVSDTTPATRICSVCLSVAYSSRETPGPIPNPEAKPANADGTATGRLWESKKPPTLNKTNNSITPLQGPRHHLTSRAFRPFSHLTQNYRPENTDPVSYTHL